jgi:hypothetical protein
MFQHLCENFFIPQIDLFASRLNHKVQSYVAWRPDPQAVAKDAFTISWTELLFYAFPPFSLITRVLQKIREDSAEGFLVVPFWETQPWFPLLIKMLVAHPLILPQSNNLLYFHTKSRNCIPYTRAFNWLLATYQEIITEPWLFRACNQHYYPLLAWRYSKTVQDIPPAVDSIMW